jgi:hypothetical protein
MHILTRDGFLSRKKSDTIVIYGSGYSINDITEDQWSKLNKFDSIGFNWFLKSKRTVTFYLLREQDIWRKNGTGDESRREVRDTLNQCYANTCCIIVDLSRSHHKWQITEHYGKPIYQRRINLPGVIVKEIFAKTSLTEYIKNKNSKKVLCDYLESYDIFEKGLIYDFCSLVSILHLVTFLKYKRIIFAGVDLYDHRYFWLNNNKLRTATREKGRMLNSKHFVADYTCRVIDAYGNYFKDVDISVLNPKSLLAKKIKIWSF